MTACSVLPLTAALHGADVAADLIRSLRSVLTVPGVQVIDAVPDAKATSPLALLLVTGGTERQAIDAWRARQAVAPGEPVLLLTHPQHNSLPAALETLAKLQTDGARGRIVMLQPGTTSEGLDDALRDVTVWHGLRRSRVGLVGTPSDWLVASVPRPDALRRRWGPTLVDVPLPQVMGRFEENIEAPIAVPVRLAARPGDHTPHPADIETAARFEPVLRGIAGEERLDAIAVRCFDLVTDAHTSGCLALSSLNDRGIVAGCEGDVASTVAMLWVKLQLGSTAWMANPSEADRESGVIELAHCTVPLSMVAGYRLDTHFESNLGVAVAGELPSGPVTLVRLGGEELEHLWCVNGEALPTTPRSGRCRTQLDVRVDPVAVGELLDHPLGNHLVVVYGHHAEQLRAWWQEMVA
ncbi:MAG: hypothetical protein Q7V57_00250 [Actinomycetota bacterium]|nr:hypothetical protein [Actinomycetota bacterium]